MTLETLISALERARDTGTKLTIDPAGLPSLIGLLKSCAPSKSEGISEAEALRLAAISTASLCNTRESAKQMRIGRDHPYWTQAYEDVCEAVEREMALREELKAMQSASEGRNAVIEECAKVCDKRVAPPGRMTANDYEAIACAKDIRALKTPLDSARDDG